MRLLLFLSVLILSAAHAVTPIDPRDFRNRSEIEGILKTEQAILEKSGASSIEATAASRIERVSAKFLKRPFVDGNLGEGMHGEHDNDPLARTDVFDCTTLVETVLAITRSTDWESFKRNMLRIRYADGNVHFLTRNHFTEVDWNHNNEKDGVFEDVTQKLFPTHTLVAETDIDKAGWYKAMKPARLVRPDLGDAELASVLERLKRDTEAKPVQRANLFYVPYRLIIRMTEAEFETRKVAEAAIRKEHEGKPTLSPVLTEYRLKFLAEWKRDGKIDFELLKRIPNAAIVNYTHPERPLKELIGTNMLVSHQGFLIWKNGVLHARHASLGDKVTDIDFVEYINQFLVPGKLNLEPQGINILQAKD